jgi:hypothetical protein
MSRDYTQDSRTYDSRPARPATRGYGSTEELPYVLGNGTVREYAETVADSIIEEARTEPGPVVWITGNSYMPPLRSITLAERVYQADNNDDGELWAWFTEMVEGRLQAADVAMECPDYDNALYAVDLRRWQYREDTDYSDDLNDEWEPKDGG